jgi:hypothetical protein
MATMVSFQSDPYFVNVSAPGGSRPDLAAIAAISVRATEPDSGASASRLGLGGRLPSVRSAWGRTGYVQAKGTQPAPQRSRDEHSAMTSG